MTLRDLLNEPESFPWNFALFLPQDEYWTLNTTCKILDPNECDDDEQHLAAEGFHCALGINLVQSIVHNARAQKASVSLEDLLSAFLFYYDNDAYMEFS